MKFCVLHFQFAFIPSIKGIYLYTNIKISCPLFFSKSKYFMNPKR